VRFGLGAGLSVMLRVIFRVWLCLGKVWLIVVVSGVRVRVGLSVVVLVGGRDKCCD